MLVNICITIRSHSFENEVNVTFSMLFTKDEHSAVAL
jgi:hypothetical protein